MVHLLRKWKRQRLADAIVRAGENARKARMFGADDDTIDRLERHHLVLLSRFKESA